MINFSNISCLHVDMKRVFCTYLLGFFVSYSEGSATLTVPTAGNCGDDTILTCQVTGSIGFTTWFGVGRSLLINGNTTRPEDTNKYTETRGTSSFSLTIHNNDLTDEGEYRCENGFDQSQLKRLKIECKASAADLSVTHGKKVYITVDKLYPSSPALSASFKKENTDVQVAASRTCSSSTQYPGYYRCVWSSSNSLADGSYTYSTVVTTITQADPLTGSFKIVSPKSPVILNTSTLDDNRIVLYGNEGQPLTIQCTSTGGSPMPTVAWYQDSISVSNQLTSSSSGLLHNDGTYSVTLQHTFTPTATDDKKTLICRSYYPQADSAYRGSETTTVMLYLRLTPSQPSATQVSSVSSGGTVEVRCTTTGSRPAATITWSYQGSTFTGQDSNNTDIATETFTVVSTIRRQVTAADNGGEVQCVVKHPTLVSPSERMASINLNVQFPASSTVITDNKVMTATGTATLALTCTTGSSNPASDITWKNGSATLNSNRSYTNSTGENNGVVRSQQLILTPTRYMDGDVVTCLVSNHVSQSPVTDTATLDLRYCPLIEAMHDRVAVEGNKTDLLCSASSKPASTFKWFREGHSGVIYEGNGTLDSNQLAYRIDHVNRTDAGTYRCNANNGIQTEDEKYVSLIVHYPPVVNVVTTNTSVKAISVSLECSASGIPNNSYVYGKWIQTWPGQSRSLKEYPRSKKLELRNLTYEHSGVYTCSASNGIKVFGADKEYMEGSGQLVVKSYPVIIKAPEKMSSKLKENVSIQIDFYSNAENPQVSIYKNMNGSREHITSVISQVPTTVDLPVFTDKIKTNGIRAVVRKEIDSKDDFGLYDVVVSNEINSTFRTIEIIPKGPPDMPLNLSVDDIQYKAVSLSWARGYHGGLPQTFVTQVSADLKKWWTVSSIFDGKNESAKPVSTTLTELKDSTRYFLRVFSFNNEGNSSYTNYVNFTTKAGAYVEEKSASVVAGAVGGTSAGLIIIALVIILVVMYRRKSCTKENLRDAARKIRRKKTSTDENKIEMSSQHNPVGVYEQLQRSEERGNRYLYDSLEVTTDNKHVYENFKKEAKATVHKAAPRDDNHATYENLKLNL